MDTLSVNANTLAVLYEQSPSSFDGMTLEENMLKYNGEEVDISSFNINDLLTDNNNFAASLGSLSPEDVFKIIRLHATLLGNTNSVIFVSPSCIYKFALPVSYSPSSPSLSES